MTDSQTGRSLIGQESEAVAQRWFDALRRGEGAAAIGCLADDVVWENNPPLPGFEGVIPWLGIFRSSKEVAESTYLGKPLAS